MKDTAVFIDHFVHFRYLRMDIAFVWLQCIFFYSYQCLIINILLYILILINKFFPIVKRRIFFVKFLENEEKHEGEAKSREKTKKNHLKCHHLDITIVNTLA